ncbi:hypothetical protein GCM10011378_12560 [Hymenobacter glacieicola]|uniref:Uncharacterized protein n=2 Tax=Hymenobacter glacieicola TaxID=1562124 RepID=A0ABQ1WMR0_9BACT|nr:hypothetical protein GCM10011378_12560 [Hymenobacter glacieicola]
MCTQLQQENQKKQLTTLSKEEATQLFTRMLMTSLPNEPELMARLTNDPTNARAYGEKLGRRIGLDLVKSCEVSRPMFLAMSGQTSAQLKPAEGAETKLVNILATEFCTKLTPQQKQLQALSADERLKVVSVQLENSFKAHAKEIQQLYGPDAMSSNEKMKALGAKVGYQAGQQCTPVMQTLLNAK